MDGDERDDKAGGRIKLFIGSYHSYSICFIYLFICVFVFFIYYRTSLISTRFSFFLFLFICFLGGVIWKLKKKLALGNLAWLAIGRPFGFCLFIVIIYAIFQATLFCLTLEYNHYLHEMYLKVINY